MKKRKIIVILIAFVLVSVVTLLTFGVRRNKKTEIAKDNQVENIKIQNGIIQVETNMKQQTINNEIKEDTESVQEEIKETQEKANKIQQEVEKKVEDIQKNTKVESKNNEKKINTTTVKKTENTSQNTEKTAKEKVTVSTTENKQNNTEEKKQVETKKQEEKQDTKEVSKQDNSAMEVKKKFDINYWISYATTYGKKIGLNYDKTARACWDNPIVAGENVTTTTLERDIQGMLKRYKNTEGFTDFYVWAEKRENGKYNLYIGYA